MSKLVGTFFLLIDTVYSKRKNGQVELVQKKPYILFSFFKISSLKKRSLWLLWIMKLNSSHGTVSLINPLRTADGYSSSLRDATGLVDLYSRIPTSTQWCVWPHSDKYAMNWLSSCICSACPLIVRATLGWTAWGNLCIRMHIRVVVKSDYQHPGLTRRSTQLATQPSLGKNTGKLPTVHNNLPSASG